jgi:hypothetical protein
MERLGSLVATLITIGLHLLTVATFLAFMCWAFWHLYQMLP